MIVHIYSNMTRKNAFEVTTAVYNQLKRLNVSIVMDSEVKEYFPDFDTEFMPIEKSAPECDIIIAIGGDGTIIHAAHYAAECDKPVLGINAGRLGFLAGLEKQELELLENLITGKYSVDKRMMLKVKHFAEGELKSEHYCLNDCVVARGLSLRLCEIEAYSNGRKVKDYLADGLIVATPTGSTAYSLSAGGPVVDTAIESLILTPICSHSLFSRSMIFEPDTVITVEVKNTDTSLPVFSCDGEIGISLLSDSKIEISRAERTAKIIKIKADSFSDILSQKMVERYKQEQGR